MFFSGFEYFGKDFSGCGRFGLKLVCVIYRARVLRYARVAQIIFAMRLSVSVRSVTDSDKREALFGG